MEYGYKLTTHGLEVMTACMAQKAPLTLTRVAMGSGQVPEGTNLADVHELVHYVVDGAIGTRRHEENRLYLTVQYENQKHPETPVFMMSEFIVYAEHPVTGEETDLLYATLGDYRQPIPPYLDTQPPSVWRYPLIIVLSNDVEVVVTAPLGTVTYDQLEQTLATAMQAHAADENAHQDIREQMTDAIAAHNTDPDAHAGIISAQMAALLDPSSPDSPVPDAVAGAVQALVDAGTIVDRQTVLDMLSGLGAGGGGYYGTKIVTVPASGWVAADAPNGDYSYVCDVTQDVITSELVPIGVPLLGSFAAAAGCVPGCETFDGYIRFYASSVPTADFQALVILFRQSGDNENSVSIGKGLTFDESGAIAVNAGDGLTFDANDALIVDTPTNDEANSAIDGVFDGNT